VTAELIVGDRWRDDLGRTLTVTEVGAVAAYFHIDGEQEPRKIPAATLARVLGERGTRLAPASEAVKGPTDG
jgi:hypothetical protein